jgi:hypothetical protein
LGPAFVSPSCATQLLNAGCRVTSIQKYLGYKKLNTTMIYARVLDKTMANDYFKAMRQIEQQLTMPTAILYQPPSKMEMLVLANSLVNSALTSTQFEIVKKYVGG